MTIEEIIEKSKAEETPDTILLVADNPIAQKLVLTWKTVEITQPDSQQEFASLKEVWAATSFEQKQWYIHAGLAPHENQRIGRSLIANGIVYPDGTVNGIVSRFLNSQVADLVARLNPALKKEKSRKPN